MEHIKAFEIYLRDNGKAEKTIESYTGDMKGYIQYLNKKGITYDNTINRFSVNSYKNHLIDSNYHPTTINKKLNSLQSLNMFLVTTEQMKNMVINLARDRIKIVKGSEKQVQVYPDDVVDALLFHMESGS